MDKEKNSYRILRVTQTDKEKVSNALALAFQENALTKYYIPDSKERDLKKGIVYDWYVQYGLQYGEVYATQDFEGVSIWLRYWDNEITFNRFTESGGREFLRKLNMDRSFYSRWLLAENCHTSLHKKWAKNPHWCLFLIGVNPCCQGKGYAGLLLREKLAEIDKDNMSCYLETHEKKNVGLYEHFGFEILEELFIPKSSLPVWILFREKEIKSSF